MRKILNSKATKIGAVIAALSAIGVIVYRLVKKNNEHACCDCDCDCDCDDSFFDINFDDYDEPRCSECEDDCTCDCRVDMEPDEKCNGECNNQKEKCDCVETECESLFDTFEEVERETTEEKTQAEDEVLSQTPKRKPRNTKTKTK